MNQRLPRLKPSPGCLDYAALVLSHDDWHSGVIGIVAGRLVEEFGLPVVLIATPDETGRGSARSVDGRGYYGRLGGGGELFASLWRAQHGGRAQLARRQGLPIPARPLADHARNDWRRAL